MLIVQDLWQDLFVDNLALEIHKIKCKVCYYFLEYGSVKDTLIKYKCLSCKKNYSKKFDEKLKKRFRNTFKISNNYINIDINININLFCY